MATRVHPRTRAEISRYFAGLDMVEPGLVPVQQWRAPFDPAAEMASAYGAVGRKP